MRNVCGLYLSLALTIHKFCVWGANRLEGLVEPCEQTIVNEAGFVVSLVRNAVKPPLMLADADSSDGAKLTYRIRKTYVQSSVESQYVVPLFSMKVSGSRTGQDACILKLAPRLMSKRQGKLIDG